MITIEKSYDLFISTLSRLDNQNLSLSDDDLDYEIFEELGSEYHSFLHEWTVDRLIKAKRIPDSIRERILNLRQLISRVIDSKNTVFKYRNDPDWKNVRKEGNAILEILKGYQLERPQEI